MNDRARRRIACASLAGLLGPAAAISVAQARSVARVPYARSEVWSTAVRLLRVNGNLPIREKDEAAGYVLFDYVDGGKTYRASAELVGLAEGAGGNATEVIITIAELPRRFEAQLLDRLSEKLRDERGNGNAPRASAPAQPPTPSPTTRAGRSTAERDPDPPRGGGPDAGLPSALPRLEGQP